MKCPNFNLLVFATHIFAFIPFSAYSFVHDLRATLGPAFDQGTVHLSRSGKFQSTALLAMKGDLCSKSSHLKNTELLTRQQALRAGLGLVAGVGLWQGVTQEAAANELYYEKVEPLQGNIFKKERDEKVFEFEQDIRAAAKALSGVELYVADRDWLAIRQALRVPPLALLRGSGKKMLNFMDDDVRANVEPKLLRAITGIEKLDVAASKGSAGAKNADKQLDAAYADVVQLMNAYLEVLP
mmetsp:Transcript_22553/g.32726  ORF Transcript_22553/g.32726 Transcript_22553/m.32726 type:complete len:240 (-) Transcript_22553:71-790(-)|eukprot:CAMPEP_0113939038 /NCGR_PEP_ID=MMETSP1339-20121228/5435_1 /TAXON_ID=94617 /ORGANISM="Fibrocapsa japonica" /LENGTH=239 /DNA_ID=CAMNT_0000942425 /DNA_START=56 /DNA_END=775 /DNA_ORIENTATION=- /assembly_acc=CAM_ASM_000762